MKKQLVALAIAASSILVVGAGGNASAADAGNWVYDNSCPTSVGVKSGRICFYLTRSQFNNVNANVSTRDSDHSGNFYSTGAPINNQAFDVTNGFSSTSISLCNGFNYLNNIRTLSAGAGTISASGTSSYRAASSGCI